jgi:serine/threonine-protein kinase RsbW
MPMENIDIKAKEIKIASKTENIRLVEKFIDGLCEEHKVNQDFYGNILIAITEAVNNAIIHGNQSDPGKNIIVTCKSNSNKLSFLVEDQGGGFDYQNLPDPTSPDNIEKPNGRGVFLMRNLADEVKFNDSGSIVELVFDLSVN